MYIDSAPIILPTIGPRPYLKARCAALILVHMDLPKTVMVAKLVDAVSSKILICITYYNATNPIIENRRGKHKTYPKEQNVN